ncbi:MAG: DUF4065 domain-containing protein [Chitinophagaceae bacterium]
MQDVNAVCDYIIFRLKSEDNQPCNNLKLQKLLYYTQAWYLAFNSTPLFNGEFQAWIHGPVHRDIYDRFKDRKGLYSEMWLHDIQNANYYELATDIKQHIDDVLEIYAGLDGSQLERLTHSEDPWIEARRGIPDTQRCENTINQNTMIKYYQSKMK